MTADFTSALTRALGRARDAAFVLSFVFDIPLRPARTRERDLALALRLAPELGIAPHHRDLIRDPALHLARFRGLSLDLALTRVRERATVRVGHPSRALDLALAENLNRVFDILRGLDSTQGPADVTATRTPGNRPGVAARRLTSIAARLLPAEERDRYGEEFGSELAEIARTGGRRRTQLAYASRQVLYARQLRAELRAPRRRGAVQ